MRRRAYLRAGLAAAGTLTVGGRVAASESTAGPGSDVGSRSPSDPLEPAGSVAVDGLSEVVVDDSGEVAYGAIREGFVTFDVSDPATPTELARVTGILEDVPDGPVTDVYDVSVSGDRLLVAGPNYGPGRDDAAGFEVHDVSDPAAPERIAGTETVHGAHNCCLAGDTAFVTGSGIRSQPLVIYDVAGDPEEVARWSLFEATDGWGSVSRNLRSCHDVTVRDGVAYVAYWDAGTWMLDVSDPATPWPVAKVGGLTPSTIGEEVEGARIPPRLRELPGNSHYALPSDAGDVLAVGKEAWDDDNTEDHDGGPGGIELWDVSDPTDAQRLTIIAPPGEGHTAHNFGWRGDRLYTSWYGGGVKVFDASDPAAPALLGDWAAEGKASMWTAKPTAAGFVASSYVDPRKDREARFDGVGAKLYSFPGPPADGAGAAGTVTARPDAAADDAVRTFTRTSTTTTTETTTSKTRSTTTAGTGDNAPTGDGTGDGTDGSQPGFGILAAVAGLGAGAWALRRRREDR